ncbi:MAG: WecB/TagA/CpsF family glycosyltransferase [Pirellulales bacterium]|nr:WecB/TagA/CpsF family glycosyltransferase [Pirellulales bacterium]
MSTSNPSLSWESNAADIVIEQAAPLRAAPPLEMADLFGVKVSLAGPDEVVGAIMHLAERRASAIVDFMGVHGLTTAQSDAQFRSALNQFDIVACDGQPVRWALNWYFGAGINRRVYGPDTTLRVCEEAARRGLGVYLYGGKPEVLAALERNLAARIPELNVVGAESPPFRPLTDEEHAAVDCRVADSGAAIVLIGLGCPKQELFAAAHRDGMPAVQLCVGAAFDFHAGVLKMAPAWMQHAGLEWFFRLCCEPRRLWKRYLVGNTKFIAMCLRRTLLGG